MSVSQHQVLLPPSGTVPKRHSAKNITVFSISILACLAVLSWCSPLLLDYYYGIPLCASNMNITSRQSFSKSAIEWVNSKHVNNWLQARGVLNSREILRSLQPASCCKIQHLGWAGEDKITLSRILFGGPSYYVVIADPRITGYRPITLGVPMNVCANVTV